MVGLGAADHELRRPLSFDGAEAGGTRMAGTRFGWADSRAGFSGAIPRTARSVARSREFGREMYRAAGFIDPFRLGSRREAEWGRVWPVSVFYPSAMGVTVCNTEKEF